MLAGGLLAFLTIPAEALQEPDSPPFTMSLGARIQVRHTGSDANDTNTIRVQRARLSLSGSAYEHFTYAIQADLVGSGGRLLDANVRYAPTSALTLWFGQGKAYFGRQWLTSSANLHFVDRTIVDGRFSAGRQQGIALLARGADSRLEFNAGVYNGEGIGQSVNEDNRFMTVGRVVFTPFGSYAPMESAHDYPEDARLALGISALQNRTGEGAEELGISRLGGEAAFKLRGLNLTAELYREWADPAEGADFTTDGWYLQGGYLFPGLRHEVAGRYAAIRGEDSAEDDRSETGVGYSYYLRGHRAKLQADFRNIHTQATDTDVREVRVQFQLAM